MQIFSILIHGRNITGPYYQNFTVAASSLARADELVADYFNSLPDDLEDFDESGLLEEVTDQDIETILEISGRIFYEKY